MMYTDCDFPEFYVWSEPTAKKDHRCCECGTPIKKGEKHFHGRGKWDGLVEVYRQHLDCMAACMLIRDRFNDHECIPFGSLLEKWQEIRWQYWRKRDRDKEDWRELRAFMAKILRRRRAAERAMKELHGIEVKET